MKKVVILLVGLVWTSFAYGQQISLKKCVSSDNYALYYDVTTLSLGNISTSAGTFTFESFYDDFGLSDHFNGINTFGASMTGARLFLNNHYRKLYYQIGIGNDDFQDAKDHMFYDLVFAYLIPVDVRNNIVLNTRFNRFRFQMNPLASYLGIVNNVMSVSLQFKLARAYIEATYLINQLNESKVKDDLLVDYGIISTIPENTLTTFYAYAYTPVFEGINAGVVLSASNSEMNAYQPTHLTLAHNYYTYFPYFTPISSKAFSLLFIARKSLNIGSINFGAIMFKAQAPVISSTKLLYEVKEGFITAADSVYYDYSGVEPLKIDATWKRSFGNSGYSLQLGYSYFDKPYIENRYFGTDQEGYKNQQITFQLTKSL